jgi:hypothetical protein
MLIVPAAAGTQTLAVDAVYQRHIALLLIIAVEVGALELMGCCDESDETRPTTQSNSKGCNTMTNPTQPTYPTAAPPVEPPPKKHAVWP